LAESLKIFIPHCSGLLTDHLPHGDGLVAHGFISRLAERGHRVWVATERVELTHSLGSNVNAFVIGSGSKATGFKRLDYMRQVRSLFRRLSRGIDFDLIHQLNPVYTGVSLALWGFDVPVVLGPYVADWPNDPDGTAASYPALSGVFRHLEKAIAKLQQHHARALLLTTEAARRKVISPRRAGSRCYLVPHGIDAAFFSPAPSSPGRDPARRQRILFLANVAERKGIFDLLRAFETVQSRFNAAELWIAGAGEDLEHSRAFAAGLRSRAQVRFLGCKTRAETVELFRRASIYCLPSHGEPYGMTVAEAMSCGLPVVVTDAGGVRHLVDERGGIRVPVHSPEALAQALSELLADPQRRRSMGAQNRARVLGTMTWDRVIDRLEEVYELTLRTRQIQPSRPRALTTSIEDYS
jgi:L-malate glycosyltransferase